MNAVLRLVALTTAAIVGLASRTSADPFYRGADVSLLPFIEQQGGVFKDNGRVEPLENILVDHGANLFRLRLFVNPDPNYADTGGAIQDLNYDIALAQRLHATGAKLLLDLHYSDTWADPGHQATPAAWANQTLPQLKNSVYDYTLQTLTAFKNAGVPPDVVQVGNEVTAGMLWPTGKIDATNESWQNFGQLLNSGISAVRASSTPQHPIQVAVHIDGGDKAGLPQWYFANLRALGGVSDYDVMGVSFYPNSPSALDNLRNGLRALASGYGKKVMVLETNYPWEGPPTGAPWTVSRAGQEQFLDDVRDTVLNLPNGAGEGFVYWYPESIPVSGVHVWQNGAIALFDQNGNALPAVNAFAVPEPSLLLPVLVLLIFPRTGAVRS